MAVEYKTIKKTVDLDVAEMILNKETKLPFLLRFSIYTLLKGANKPYFSPPSTFPILDWSESTSNVSKTVQVFDHHNEQARVSSPTCPGYKNGLKLYNHQTVYPLEFLVSENMENEAMNQIKHILDGVRSLEDLSADDIAELRCVSQQSLIINKFEILVDVCETEKRNTASDKWELSANDVREMNHRRLFQHIFEWYQSRQINLFGTFTLSVHLWYSDGDRQCIMDKAAFSPDSPIDLTVIEDVPLRLGYLMPDGSSLSEPRPSLFPLKRLVEKLQRGFEEIQIERAKLLAREKKKSSC